MLKPVFKKTISVAVSALLIAVITMLLLEATLQVAALFVEKRIHPLTGKELPADGKLRIVMMGDSNTYGLYLEERESYPSVFEKQWNQTHLEQPIQVINLGFPGTNSSRVLKSLPDVIRTFSPDIITVMVGVNDFWTAPVDVEGLSNPVSPLEGWLRDHVRSYKLLYMLRRQLYQKDMLKIDDEARHVTFDPESLKQYRASIDGKAPFISPDKPDAIQYGDISFDIGYVMDTGKNQNPSDDIKHNMLRMVDVAESSGVKLIFITYAYFEFPQKAANWQMKEVAKSRNILLINVARVFREECAKGETRCQELFFPDYHPTAEGYRVIAREIERYFIDDPVVDEML